MTFPAMLSASTDNPALVCCGLALSAAIDNAVDAVWATGFGIHMAAIQACRGKQA